MPFQLTAYHVLPDSPLMQQNFLVALASLEAQSKHPLAADVLRVAKINNVVPVSVSGFQEFPGRGLGGLLQMPHERRPRAVLLGSRAFLAESGFHIPDILEVTARKWEKEVNSVIALAGWDAWVRGVVQWKTTSRGAGGGVRE
jgi:cation transport ATPase